MFYPIQFVSENERKDLCMKFLFVDAVILVFIMVIKVVRVYSLKIIKT